MNSKQQATMIETVEGEGEKNTDATIHAEDIIQVSQEAATAKPSLWTASMFRLYGLLSLGYMCVILCGYDGSLMGGINAMTQYQDYFKLYVTSSLH